MTGPQAVLGEMRLHHVGIVVADLDEATSHYEALGFRNGERHEIREQNIAAVTFRAGPGWMELIQPTDLEGPIARYMSKRGEGVHHVAYAVDDIVATMRRLSDAGMRLIDEKPRTGAHGWTIAFIHPESCHGVLTELVQESL